MDNDNVFTNKQVVLIELAVREYIDYLKCKKKYFKTVSESNTDNLNLTHAFLTSLCLSTYNEILLLMIENIDKNDVISCINEAESMTFKKMHEVTLLYLNKAIDEREK